MPTERPLSSRASYLAYRAGSAVARVIPTRVGEPVAEAVGRSLRLVAHRRRRQVERHQRRLHDGVLEGRAKRRVVGEVFASYGRYWFEFFRLPHDARHDLGPRFDVSGFEHVTDALAVGRGVVVALPHIGGWDYAGAWLAQQGYPPVVIAEVLEPPELFAWACAQRAAMGIEVVPLADGAAAALLAALDDNRVVCLLADRDLVGDGVDVTFFGERVTMPSGPALLALRTGARLVPCAAYFRPGGRHFAVIGEPIDTARRAGLREDVGRVTQDLAARLEAMIREAPEQWHVLQPLWPSDRATLGEEDFVTAVAVPAEAGDVA